MLLYELVLRSSQILFQYIHAFYESVLISKTRLVKEPKSAISQRELMNHFRTDGNLYLLDDIKYQGSQFRIKRIYR